MQPSRSHVFNTITWQFSRIHRGEEPFQPSSRFPIHQSGKEADRAWQPVHYTTERESLAQRMGCYPVCLEQRQLRRFGGGPVVAYWWVWRRDDPSSPEASGASRSPAARQTAWCTTSRPGYL